jgi:hypothetical protein
VVFSATSSDSRLLQAKGHCLARQGLSESKGKGTMDSREARPRTGAGNMEMDSRENRDRERRDRDGLDAASGWKSDSVRVRWHRFMSSLGSMSELACG